MFLYRIVPLRDSRELATDPNSRNGRKLRSRVKLCHGCYGFNGGSAGAGGLERAVPGSIDRDLLARKRSIKRTSRRRDLAHIGARCRVSALGRRRTPLPARKSPVYTSDAVAVPRFPPPVSRFTLLEVRRRG